MAHVPRVLNLTTPATGAGSTISDPLALADLADSLPDSVVVIDAQGRVCWANQAAVRLVGRDMDAWIGVNGFELIHPADVGLAMVCLASVQGKQVGDPVELRIAGPTGWTLVELVGSPLRDGHIALSLRDVTERRTWELAGNDDALARALVHHAAGITLLVDPAGTLLSASSAITRQLGHDTGLICGHPFSDVVADDDVAVLNLGLADALEGALGEGTEIEVRLCHADGRTVPFQLTIVSLIDDPTVHGLVISGHDITRLSEAREALEQFATFDALTGLLNRRVFDEGLEREWSLTHRDGIDSIVIVCDLDGFKNLNDDYGHAAGDTALRDFGLALRSIVRDTDLVARRGGDEFAIVLARYGSDLTTFDFEDKLRQELARRPWPGNKPCGVTIGHQSLLEAASPQAALHQADLSMLRAKKH